MIIDYYYADVVWAPRKPDTPDGKANFKVKLQEPEQPREIMIRHGHYDEIAHIEKGDTVMVTATPKQDGGFYYDLARAAYPEKMRRQHEDEDVDRLARLYGRFKRQGVDDPEAAQKMAVTVFIRN